MVNDEGPINSLRYYCRNRNLHFHQNVVNEVGLPHERIFHVQTIVSPLNKFTTQEIFDGFGRSIKGAKQNSAFVALSSLKDKGKSFDYKLVSAR